MAIIVSSVFRLGRHGVDTVGEIAAGLRAVHAVRLNPSDLWVLFPQRGRNDAGDLQRALGAGQTYADKHGYRLNPSQDMLALGLANVSSGVLGGLGCGGSLSQTVVNEGAGARSQVSTLMAAVLSLVTVLPLTPLFTNRYLFTRAITCRCRQASR